ncbi:MAG: HAMP domain-containing histidine kinase [Hyphomicrobiales bacterium]|nr:HAMP domain-containing histidine kinase [Hyphomicrobiales bacterium]
MARMDAAVPPLHAAVSGRAASTRTLPISLPSRFLMRAALAFMVLLALTLASAQTLLDLYAARELHLGQALEQADATASLIAQRLDNSSVSAATLPKLAGDANSAKEPALANAQRLLTAALPFHAPPSEMLVGVTDRSGQIVASLGFQREIRSIADLVGREHIAETNRTNAARVITPDGVDSIVAIRNLAAPLGQVAIVTPTAHMLTLWQAHAQQLARLAATGACVILILAAACIWQRRSARLAKNESRQIRAKMQTALMDTWRNEQEVLEKEQRLVAMLADLERSREEIERQSCELGALVEHYLAQRKRIESANRAKAEFLANMSHELRTPLNAIIGFSEIMETGLFGSLGSAKYGEYVSDIRRSGEYLLSVVSDILEMARIESGRRRIKRQPALLKDILGEAATGVADAARARKQKLVIEAPPAPLIEADARALIKVLVHIARDAVDHTGEGGTVTIRAKLYPRHLSIHVVGSDANVRPRLFIPEALPATVGTDQIERRQGTSLGFALARSLVELHGGRLRVRSRSASRLGPIVVLSLPRGQNFVSADTLKAEAA